MREKQIELLRRESGRLFSLDIARKNLTNLLTLHSERMNTFSINLIQIKRKSECAANSDFYRRKSWDKQGSLGRRSDTADPLLSPFSLISALPLSNKHPFSAEESY